MLKSSQTKQNRGTERDLKIVIRKLENEIPGFKDCRRCGECCGPLVMTIPEYSAVIKELSRTDQFQQVAQNLLREDYTVGGEDRYTCPLLIIETDPDKLEGRKTRCMVYRKRPIICRAQGVKTGMPCEWDKKEHVRMRSGKLWKKYGELSAASKRIELRPAIKEYINQWAIQHDIRTGKIETIHVKAKRADEEESESAKKTNADAENAEQT